MNILKCGLVILAASIFVFACSQSSSSNTVNSAAQTANSTAVSNNSAPVEPSADTELAAARKIYAEKCVACHKENGEGGKVNLDGAEFNVPSYKSDRSKNKTDDKLLDKIVNGDDEMPAFKDKLSSDQMKSLVKMIRKDYQGK